MYNAFFIFTSIPIVLVAIATSTLTILDFVTKGK